MFCCGNTKKPTTTEKPQKPFRFPPQPKTEKKKFTRKTKEKGKENPKLFFVVVSFKLPTFSSKKKQNIFQLSTTQQFFFVCSKRTKLKIKSFFLYRKTSLLDVIINIQKEISSYMKMSDNITSEILSSNETVILDSLMNMKCPTNFEQFLAQDKTSRSLLFHSSQFFILFAILVPLGRYCSSITHALLGCSFMTTSIWLYESPCYQIVLPNLLYWSSFLTIANFLRSAFLFYNSFDGLIRRDLRIVYKKIFEPLGVTPSLFRKLFAKSRTEQLDDGEHYALEQITKIDRLSILISGR